MKNKSIITLALAILLIAVLPACRDNSKGGQSTTSTTTQQANSVVDDTLPAAPSFPILDMVGILNQKDSIEIGKKIKELDSLKLAQVAVVITNDLKGMNAHDYATKLGNKWGVGHKETNDGITIVIKPKMDDTPEGGGKAAIATGLGMEKILSNDMCLSIIQDVMVPEFQQNKYGEAVENALDKIKDILTGDKD